MLKIVRMALVIAGLILFAVVATSVTIAQEASGSAAQSNASSRDNSPSNATQSDAGSPTQNDAQAGAAAVQAGAGTQSNLPLSQSSTTRQQVNAPVVDPEKAAQDSARAKAGGQAVPAQANGAQNSIGTDTATMPAPQRDDSRSAGPNTMGSRPGRASLGVNVLGSEDGRGIVVARIRPGTPAQQMGLQPRDRILSLNGQPMRSVDEFIGAIRGMAAGDEVQLTVDRDGNARDLAGRLEAFRDAVAAGQGPVGNIMGRARDFVGRERMGENLQAGYEEGSRNSLRNSGDMEARIARLEQQIDRLSQEIQQLRNGGNNSQPSSRPSAANTQPGTSTPGATLAQPPGPEAPAR